MGRYLERLQPQGLPKLTKVPPETFVSDLEKVLTQTDKSPSVSFVSDECRPDYEDRSDLPSAPVGEVEERTRHISELTKLTEGSEVLLTRMPVVLAGKDSRPFDPQNLAATEQHAAAIAAITLPDNGAAYALFKEGFDTATKIKKQLATEGHDISRSTIMSKIPPGLSPDGGGARPIDDELSQIEKVYNDVVVEIGRRCSVGE
jgi:hypothetical protein